MSSPEKPLHILVVEDNRTQAEYLRQLLEKRECVVTVSGNGFDALEKIKEKKPDIILTDVMMPDMDGWETIREIESRDLYHKIIICMLTAKDNPDEGMIAIRTGNTRCSILLPMENKALDIPTISLPIRILTMKSV